jgi:hypothetical protein
MQISNNIQNSYLIEINDLNNINNIEGTEGVSVVRLSRVEQCINLLRNNHTERILTILSVSCITLVWVLLPLIVLDLYGVLDVTLESFDKVITVFYCATFIYIITSTLLLLYNFGVVSKCLNKRKTQNIIDIKYKNLELYQGNITEFKDKLSVIKLEELGSAELKDPIVYNKQLYSFKEFKKAIKISNGIVPHDKLLVEPAGIKKLK